MRRKPYFEVLGNVPNHSIVRVDEYWGVVREGANPQRGKWATVDFWYGGLQRVWRQQVVEVVPPPKLKCRL